MDTAEALEEVLFVKPSQMKDSQRETRARENARCPGWLRRPARALQGEWAAQMREQGRGLSAVLDNVLDMYPQCESVVDDILAGCHTDGFPKAAELTAAKVIQMWAHAPYALLSENTFLHGAHCSGLP